MLRLRTAAIAAAAALALVLVAIVIAACSGDDGDDPTATPTTPTATVGGGARDIEATFGDPQALDPGSYRPSAFIPSAAFSVGEGWSAALSEADFIHLFRGDQPNANCICIIRPQSVYDPATTQQVPIPADLTEWLQAHPDLDTTNASSLQINDIAARQMEALVGGNAAAGGESVILFSGESNYAFTIESDEKTHLVVVDHPVGDVVIAIRAQRAEFDAYFIAAERVIGSLTLAR